MKHFILKVGLILILSGFFVSGCDSLKDFWHPEGSQLDSQLRYTVTFDPNGATGGSAPPPMPAAPGSAINLPNRGTLTKANHTFDGWNIRSDGGGTNYTEGASFTVTGNVTLYANWVSTVETFTVTFNLGLATTIGSPPPVGAPPSPQTGASITLPDNFGFSWANRTFAGWSRNVNGTGTVYEPGAIFTPDRDGIILYARWEATITFNENNHQFPEDYSHIISHISMYNQPTISGELPGPITALVGSNVTLPTRASHNLNRSYSTFAGWNTANDGSGDRYTWGTVHTNNSSIMLQEDTTLFAWWTVRIGFMRPGWGDHLMPAPFDANVGAIISLPAQHSASHPIGTFIPVAGWSWPNIQQHPDKIIRFPTGSQYRVIVNKDGVSFPRLQPYFD